jgi:hypothetical protein
MSGEKDYGALLEKSMVGKENGYAIWMYTLKG